MEVLQETGPRVLRPASWRELIAELAAPPPRSEFDYMWFRGQGDESWTLGSSLSRGARGLVPGDELRKAENLAIASFKNSAAHLLPQAPRDDEPLRWMHLMQHYGAPTRLIDWTESPFIGLYFAVADATTMGQPAALWCLNHAACDLHYGLSATIDLLDPTKDHTAAIFEKLIAALDDPEEIAPLPLMLTRPDGRMLAQAARIVATTNDEGSIPVDLPSPPASDTMRAAMADPGFVDFVERRSLLTKIIIEPDWRIQILEALEDMHIIHERLFPGVEGVGRGLTHDLSWAIQRLVAARQDST